MLKIKDNVDLKELKKFGFIFHKKLGVWFKIVGGYGEVMSINSKRMIIYNDYLETLIFDLWNNTIYDLIKADMVEKVVDDESNKSN